MRTQRKFLAILMALCLMISMMPIAAFAEGEENPTFGYCGAEGSETDVTWKLEQNNQDSDNPTYTLTISGTDAMKDYSTSSTVPWYSYFNSISTVKIEEGITHIGKWIVKDSTSLENIQISSTVQSISEKAFHYTTKAIPVKNITVASENGYISFEDNALFSNDGENHRNLILYIGNVAEFEIPADVKNIYAGAFVGNSNLQTVTFAENSQIKMIGENAFRNCSSLSSCDFPSGLESIKANAFMSTGLTEITIPDSVTTLEDAAFSGCSSAKNITIGTGLTELPQQVFQNTGIEQISIPANIVKIGMQAFSGCSALASIDIPRQTTELGNKAFFNCTALKNVILPDSISTIGSGVFEGCTALEKLVINGAITSVSNRLCYGCTSLKVFVANGSISNIGSNAFEKCTSLTTMVILGASSNITLGTSAFNDAGSNRTEYVSGSGIRTGTSNSRVAVTNGGTFTDVDALKGDMSDTPVKKGSLFEGWSTTKDATSGDKSGTFSNNQTYYAIWTECNPHQYGEPTWSWSEDYNTATATFTCTKCGEETTETVTTTSAVTTEPTCTDIGTTTYTATVTFGEVPYTATQTSDIAATGHKWDEGKVTTPATSSTDGVKTYTCTVCNATKTETIPATGGSHSSSSSSTTYTVAVDTAKNGTVSVSPKNASKGTTVTITAKPNDGYEVDEVIVTDKNGDIVKVTAKGNDKYTFVMPAGKVDVEVTFVKEYVAPSVSFTDVKANAWYYDAALYAAENGLMSGTGNGAFSPDLTTSRAMIWTILARVDGQNISVQYGNWYDKAQAWAIARGVSDGTSPNAPITREQLAVMLYGFAKDQGYVTTGGVSLSRYTDASDVSAWAVEALEWAVGNGLISSMGNNILAPTGTATRAQVAVILMNFCENIAK